MAVDFRRLIEAGVHFGHQTFRWCPKMKPYIWGSKNKVHLIDVSKTASQIEKASQFLNDIVAGGKQILWVGTKKSAQKLIRDTAKKFYMPYVNHRWIGGTLSNHGQVKKSLTKWVHLEDVLDKSEKFSFYTKKELNIFKKMVQRLEKSIGGLRKLSMKDLGTIIIVDVDREYSALLEAVGMDIPVIGLVDTNSDPSMVDYVIPANDDSAKSIEVIFEYLSSAIEKGAAVAAKKAEEKKAAQEKEKLAAKSTDAKVATDKKESKKFTEKKAVKEDKPVEKKAVTKKATTKKVVDKKEKETKAKSEKKVAK